MVKINGFNLPPEFSNLFWRSFRPGPLGFGNSLSGNSFRNYGAAQRFRREQSLFPKLSPIWASMSPEEKQKFWDLNHTAKGSNNWSRFVGLNASRRRSGLDFIDSFQTPYFQFMILDFSSVSSITHFRYQFTQGDLVPRAVPGMVDTYDFIPFILPEPRTISDPEFFITTLPFGFFYHGLTPSTGEGSYKLFIGIDNAPLEPEIFGVEGLSLFTDNTPQGFKDIGFEPAALQFDPEDMFYLAFEPGDSFRYDLVITPPFGGSLSGIFAIGMCSLFWCELDDPLVPILPHVSWCHDPYFQPLGRKIIPESNPGWFFVEKPSGVSVSFGDVRTFID